MRPGCHLFARASKDVWPDQELAEGEAPERGGTAAHDRARPSRSGRQREYEFTRWEERIMEVVMEAMRMAGLALGLQALSSVALGNFQEP